MVSTYFLLKILEVALPSRNIQVRSKCSKKLRLVQVHAYERINRLYKYQYDPCGPVYITIGDGGNHEKLAVQHADDPGNCPNPSDTPDKNFPHLGGYCGFNFNNGKFCWDSQPEWSAWRDSSFGHGIMEVFIFNAFLSALMFSSGFPVSCKPLVWVKHL